MRRAKNKSAGFTLIELMITLVVVAILTVIAFPSYLKFVQKGNRASAKQAVLELAAREESYYALNNAYTATMTNMSYASASANPIPSSTQNYYSLSVSSVTAGATPGYVLQAVPVTGSPQATDACGTYQLDNLGNKTNLKGSTTLSVSGCW